MPPRPMASSLHKAIARRDSSRGLLIAFEGPDGSGKTTQRKLLQRWLESRDEVLCGKCDSEISLVSLYQERGAG